MQINPGTGYTFTSSASGHNLTIDQQWSPWINVQSSAVCPLQIYGLRYAAAEEKYYINVSPGMVNNLGVQDYDDNPLTNVPPPNIQVFTSGLTSNYTTNYIYVACDNSGSPDYLFPDPAVPPYIWVTGVPDDSDDDTGLLLIGIVKGKVVSAVNTLEIYNYKGCGSLWAERFKCGSNVAQYWWSAV